MTWVKDVKDKRLHDEAEAERRQLALRQAHADSLRPLTPAVRAMVLRLLEDVGEAFWGAGKFFVKIETSGWVLRSPPDGERYSYWYVKFLSDRDRYYTSLFGFQYRAWILWPRFEVSYRRSSSDPFYSASTRTWSLSESELKRVLKYAVSRGPAESD